MNVATTKQNLSRIDLNNGFLREELLKHALSHLQHPPAPSTPYLILLDVETGKDHSVVGEIKVGIGARKSLTLFSLNGTLLRLDAFHLRLQTSSPSEPTTYILTDQSRRNIKLVDDDLASLSVSLTLQHLLGLSADLVLGVLLVVGPGHHDLAGLHEHTEVINVAVGIDITIQSTREPDDLQPLVPLAAQAYLLEAKGLLQVLLDLLLCQIRITVVIQEALFSGQQGALAIDGNGAALENHVHGVAIQALDVADLAGNLVVILKVGVAAALFASPGVELPVRSTDDALLVHHKNGGYSIKGEQQLQIPVSLNQESF